MAKISKNINIAENKLRVLTRRGPKIQIHSNVHEQKKSPSVQAKQMLADICKISCPNALESVRNHVL